MKRNLKEMVCGVWCVCVCIIVDCRMGSVFFLSLFSFIGMDPQERNDNESQQWQQQRRKR